VAIRGGAAGLALLSNLLIARHLDIAEIAYYFTFSTVAYFGNASLFVGASGYLQRFLASRVPDGVASRGFLLAYVFGVAMIGALLVGAGSTVYFVLWGRVPVASAVLACAMLSVGAFLSTISKDLWAFRGRVDVAAGLSLLEAFLKCLMFVSVSSISSRVVAVDMIILSALASMLAGIAGGGALLLLASRKPAQVQLRISEMLGTVVPVGFGAVLNWLQLQLYRPLMLYLGVPAQYIAATSLMTTLGSSGASPALTVVAQRFIPSIYAREPRAVFSSLRRLLAVALLLAVLSVPMAYVFLLLSGRVALAAYLPLVAVGVFTEAANGGIGAIGHGCNATARSLWPLTMATAVGVLVALGMLLLPAAGEMTPYVMGCGLLLSQLVVVVVCLTVYRRGQQALVRESG